MNIYRRFIHSTSTKLGNSKHSFEVLGRLAKCAGSNDHFLKSSENVSIDPLNAVLARWKTEYLETPNETIHPRKVLEKVDEWKKLVDDFDNTNSLELHHQQELGKLLRPDEKSYMHVIQAVANSIEERSHQQKTANKKKLDFIDELLTRLIEQSKTDFSIRPNVHSFSAVMNAWAKTDIVKKEQKGINSSSRKVEELLLCMEDFYEKGWPSLQPNVVTYNILLNAWAKEGKVSNIEDTLQRMIRLEIPGPDSVSYGTLLSAYAKLGTLEAALKAESLLEQMLELYRHGMESAKPNVISFSSVIQCHARLGNGEKAEEWLQKLHDLYQLYQDPDLKADLPIYNTVIQAWVKSGQPEKAEDFLRSMMAMDNDRKSETDPGQYVQPNSQTFNTVLSAWAKIGEAERAEAILMEMHKLHVDDDFDTRPTVVTYNTVLDSYAHKTNRMMNADKKDNRSKNRNKKKEKHIRTNIEDEDAPWNRAEAILNHMIDLCRLGDNSVKPTARTWNTGKLCI
jgi:pentatricopeptide repeat protein